VRKKTIPKLARSISDKLMGKRKPPSKKSPLERSNSISKNIGSSVKKKFTKSGNILKKLLKKTKKKPKSGRNKESRGRSSSMGHFPEDGEKKKDFSTVFLKNGVQDIIEDEDNGELFYKDIVPEKKRKSIKIESLKDIKENIKHQNNGDIEEKLENISENKLELKNMEDENNPLSEIEFKITNRKIEVVNENKIVEEDNELEDKLSHNWVVDVNELEFNDKIGEGTFCVVYNGTYRGQTVAIKVLKTTSRKQLYSFTSELDIISNFRSPYVVFFFGASLKPVPLLVLGLCERGSLFDILNSDEEGIFSWGILIEYANQIVTGLNSLHSWRPQIVHRDLKTKNILVESNGQIRLCDFGESRFAIVDNLETLTRMCGTYAYLAPEIYHGKPFSPKSDMYAFAVVLWEMAARITKGKYCRPFSEFKEIKYDFQVVVAAAKKELRPTIPKETPTQLKNIISGCWSHDPTRRPDAYILIEFFKNNTIKIGDL